MSAQDKDWPSSPHQYSPLASVLHPSPHSNVAMGDGAQYFDIHRSQGHPHSFYYPEPMMSVTQPKDTHPRPGASPTRGVSFDYSRTIPSPSTPRPSSPSGSSSTAVDSPMFQQYSTEEPSVKESTVPSVYAEVAQGPSFGPTKVEGNLYTIDHNTVLTVQMNSKFDRGFFMADNDWTCYRRNYFQVSSTFSLRGHPAYSGQGGPVCLVRDNETQELQEVTGFVLGISARASDDLKNIPLIQHTPKRDKGPTNAPVPKPIRPGGNLGLLVNSSVTNCDALGDQSIVTFERNQFKSATANNGKRRAAQQYFVVILELFAKTTSGMLVQVASQRSTSLVVRGRSPGHYGSERRVSKSSVGPRSPPQGRSVPPPASTASSSAPVREHASAFQPSVPSHGVPSASTMTGEYASYYSPSLQSNAFEHSPVSSHLARGSHDRSASAPSAMDVYPQFPHDANYKYPSFRHPEAGHHRVASAGEPMPSYMHPYYYPYMDSPRSHLMPPTMYEQSLHQPPSQGLPSHTPPPPSTPPPLLPSLSSGHFHAPSFSYSPGQDLSDQQQKQEPLA